MALKFILLEERIVLDAAAVAHVVYVNGALHTNGDGSLHNPFNNLQSALAVAASNPGDQIDVAKGTYLPTTGLDSTNTNRGLSFNIPDHTTLLGGFNANFTQRNSVLNPTILSGDIGIVGNSSDNSYTVVTVGASSTVTVALDGFTVTGGNNTNSGRGGGLGEFNGSILSLSNMNFTNDSAALFGGGVYTEAASTANSTLTITNSSFSNDTAGLFGGAINGFTTQNISIKSSTFSNNSSTGGGLGGAISVIGDQNFTLASNVFNNNTITGAGGVGGAASELFVTNVNITGNIFTNNSSPDFSSGANFSEGNTTVKISNNMFANNTAGGAGGGAMYSLQDGSVTVQNNIFRNNAVTAGDLGGAVGLEGDQSVLVTHNLFLGNSAGTGGGAIGTLNDNTVTISQNLFLHNAALGESTLFPVPQPLGGGAIGDYGTTTLSITGNLMQGNTSPQGNSIWLHGESTVNGDTNMSNWISDLTASNQLLHSDDIYIL